LYFYELHEGEQDVFADVLLIHDELWEPEEFFELVQQVRRRVLDSFEHDTLIESIAIELERDHGFTFVSDDKLSAAINVSRDDDNTFIAKLDGDEDDEEDADDDPDLRVDADYKVILAEFDPTQLDNRTN
jgi:hypothetical protein